MIQTRQSTAFFSRLQTIDLPSGARLVEWLGEDGRRFYYRTGSSDSGNHPTVLAIFPGDSSAIHAQLASWESAAKLSHPNLIHVFEAGFHSIEDQPAAYALIEFPDEDLATVIEQRPLDGLETHTVATAVVSALEYLHGKGFVHRGIDPRNIVAVGESIKLLVHEIHPAEPGDEARDVQAFGMTLLQLLTANSAPGSEELTALPKPFSEIIQGAVHGGWDLKRISQLLHPVTESPVLPETPAKRVSPDFVRSRFPKWGLLLIFAAFLGVWFLWPSSRPVPAGQPSTRQEQQPVPAANPPAASAAAAAIPAVALPAAAGKSSPSDPAAWRVIAYTYAARKDAENRVRTIRTKWPRSQPEVFVPNPPAGPFLVSIGGRMTRAEAQRLQRQARSLGLPYDTFIRNFPN